jgi:hypothetical protein
MKPSEESMHVLLLSSMGFGKDRERVWRSSRSSAAEMYGLGNCLTRLSPQASDLQTSEHGMAIIRVSQTKRRKIWQRLELPQLCDKIANQIIVKNSNWTSETLR